MSKDSIGASVYSYWQIFMYKSMFRNYIPEGEQNFVGKLTNGYVFTDFFRIMMVKLRENLVSAKYNKFCDNGYHEYTGELSCAYNIARSLVETKKHLERNVSKNTKDWAWKNFHSLEYANSPWSLSPLKFLFHRKVPAAGNNGTVNVAKYHLDKA